MSEAHAHGDHAHRHEHHHEHGHTHETAHGDGRGKARGGRILTIRSHSGLSGDMFLAGLLRMTELGEAETDRLLAAVLPELAGTVRLTRRQVNRIGGWFADVSLPHQHEHRTLEDILGIIAGSGMDDEPKRLASDTFTLLAKAEAPVHENAEAKSRADILAGLQAAHRQPAAAAPGTVPTATTKSPLLADAERRAELAK